MADGVSIFLPILEKAYGKEQRYQSQARGLVLTATLSLTVIATLTLP